MCQSTGVDIAPPTAFQQIAARPAPVRWCREAGSNERQLRLGREAAEPGRVRVHFSPIARVPRGLGEFGTYTVRFFPTNLPSGSDWGEMHRQTGPTSLNARRSPASPVTPSR